MRLVPKRSHRRGDTIIEVMFAFVIFALTAVGGIAIMNRSVTIGERALEITLVRQQINAQAEALRYLHGVKVMSPGSPIADNWDEILADHNQNNASEYGVPDSGECQIPGGSNYEPFILNARTAEIWSNPPTTYADDSENLPPYAQVVYDGSSIDAAYGIWIEAVRSDVTVEKQFVDFHIRACWPGPASDVPMTLGTIVRLYDPET